MRAYEYLLEFKDRAIANVKRLARESGVLDRKTKAAGDEMRRTERKSRSMGNEFDRTSRSGSRMGRMFSGLGGQIATFITATALLAGVGNLSKASSEFEQITIAFDTMLGSVERSKKVVGDLKEFANVTPFTSDQVFKASKSLLAYNIQAEELIPILTALGNISSGVGREKLPNLILAFGQVKAATRLTGMELRQFTETGVPLLDELAKVTGKTVAVIKEELIPAGKISFDLVKQALFNATREGGKFFNLMEKQSRSFGGRVSTMTDKFGLLAIAYGDSINRFFRPAIEGAIHSADTLLGFTQSLSEQYFIHKKRTDSLISSTSPLIARYEELSGKTKLNKEEQEELKTVTQQLAEAIPSAVTAWNKYGEAIGLSSTRLRENITLSKEALKIKNADAIRDVNEQIFNLQRDASILQGKLNAIAANGGFILQGTQYGVTKQKFTDPQIQALSSQLRGITGKDGLVEDLEKELRRLRGEDVPDASGSGAGGNGNGSGLDPDINAGIDGITAGGSKSVTINFQGGIKFAENIDISAQDLGDALDQLEPQMRDFFVRLLKGGLQTI